MLYNYSIKIFKVKKLSWTVQFLNCKLQVSSREKILFKYDVLQKK